MAVLRFVSDHNEKIFGALVVLFLATSILLLIRQIGQRRDKEVGIAVPGDITVDANIDMKAIEGAMKRALASQTVATVAQASGASVDISAELQSREEKILGLQSELEHMKEELAKAAVTPVVAADGTTTIVTENPNPELQAKIEELQARLAEYEIIEDDIADLSMYKEENTRLKEEIESLKKAPAATTAAPVFDEVVEVETAVARKPAAKTEQFEIDPSNSVMAEFAAAVEVQKAPPTEAAMKIGEDVDALLDKAVASLPPLEDEESPLLESLDTDKMLSEVASLENAAATDDSALEETLDTDKLLQEVNSMNTAPETTTAATTTAQEAPVSTAPAAPEVSIGNFVSNNRDVDPAAAEDDLLSEFKDKGGQG